MTWLQIFLRSLHLHIALVVRVPTFFTHSSNLYITSHLEQHSSFFKWWARYNYIYNTWDTGAKFRETDVQALLLSWSQENKNKKVINQESALLVRYIELCLKQRKKCYYPSKSIINFSWLFHQFICDARGYSGSYTKSKMSSSISESLSTQNSASNVDSNTSVSWDKVSKLSWGYSARVLRVG